ncbi:MAG: hydroxymethylbilane synthase [Cyclobacteriaceae bacterium]|nr:hydroxymethylbilane synthase [Cyclobacteriaceae bacterium]
MKHIRIGTRGSKLALWQANFIASKLLAAGWNTQIVTIDTKGDKLLDVSISKIGSKGVFTEEIEDQLRSGSIDIAVHSAKDLQSSLPDDLELIACTERENPADILASYKTLLIDQPLTIGTSSTRRVALLKKYYPHFNIVSVRGNLQTRFEKMKNGACDALMLAYAGVYRMGFGENIVHQFPLDTFTPPTGQGIVAIEASVHLKPEIRTAVRAVINDENSEITLNTERAFLKVLEGGCSIPAFCHAEIVVEKLQVLAGLSTLDGSVIIRKSEITDIENGVEVGKSLALQILNEGGREILNEIRKSI